MLGKALGCLKGRGPPSQGGYGTCWCRRLMLVGGLVVSQLSHHGGEPVPELSRESCQQPDPHPAEPGQPHLVPLRQQLPHPVPGRAQRDTTRVPPPPQPRRLVAWGMWQEGTWGHWAWGGGSPLAASPANGDRPRTCRCLERPQLSPSPLSPTMPPSRPVGLRELQDCAHLLAAAPRGAPARHGAGPRRQSLREELQRHRLLLRHPGQRPRQPGAPGAR